MKLLNGSSKPFFNYLVQCLAISASIQLAVMAQEEKVVNVNNDQQPLNVVGEGIEEELVDGELQYLDNELNKQGKQIKLNAKKTQKYKKLQSSTEKLSDTTEKYVEEKKTSEKSIKEYNQKIKCLLDESGIDPECDAYRSEEQSSHKVAPVIQEEEKVIKDQAPVQQAAPQQPFIIQNIMPEQKSVQNNQEVDSSSPEVIPLSIGNTIEKDIDANEKIELEAHEKLKLYPFLGMSTYDGTGVSGIQSNALMGLRFESKPYAGRIAMGASIAYRQLTARDGGSYNVIYSNSAPEFEFSNTTVDLYGKLILIKESSFMPYLMGGFGYNIMSVQYRQNDFFGGNPTGTAQRNFVNATFGGGVDYAFSQSIGANLELNYSRNVSSLDNQNSPNTAFYQGQSDLNTLANNFANANLFSVQAGLIIFF